MDVLRDIELAKLDFMRRTGYRPSVVYIGLSEFKALRKLFDVSTCQAEMQIAGLRVLVVLVRWPHIACA